MTAEQGPITQRELYGNPEAVDTVNKQREGELWTQMHENATKQHLKPQSETNSEIVPSDSYAVRMKAIRDALEPTELRDLIRIAIRRKQELVIAQERHVVNVEKHARKMDLRTGKEQAVTDANKVIREMQEGLKAAKERLQLAEDIAAKACDLGIEKGIAEQDVQDALVHLDYAKRALAQSETAKKAALKILPTFVKQAEESTKSMAMQNAGLEASKQNALVSRENAGLTEEELERVSDPMLDDMEVEVAIAKFTGVQFDPAAHRARIQAEKNEDATEEEEEVSVCCLSDGLLAATLPSTLTLVTTLCV